MIIHFYARYRFKEEQVNDEEKTVFDTKIGHRSLQTKPLSLCSLLNDVLTLTNSGSMCIIPVC